MEVFSKLRHKVQQLAAKSRLRSLLAGAIAALIEQELNFLRARSTLEQIYNGAPAEVSATQFNQGSSPAGSILCSQIEFVAIFQQAFSSAIRIHEASETHYILTFPATGRRVRFKLIWFSEGDQYHCVKLSFNTSTLEITPHAEEDDTWPVEAAKLRLWQLEEEDNADLDTSFNQDDIFVINLREEDDEIGPPVLPICCLDDRGLAALVSLFEENHFPFSPEVLEFLCLAGVAFNRDCLPEVRILLRKLVRSGATSTPAVVVDSRNIHSLHVESYDRHCSDFPTGANPSEIIAEFQSSRPSAVVPAAAGRDELTALPAEILTLIICYLFPIDSSRYLRCVSKRFLALLTEEFFTKETAWEAKKMLKVRPISSMDPLKASLEALDIIEDHFPHLTLEYALQLLLAEAEAVENRLKCQEAIMRNKILWARRFSILNVDPSFLDLHIEYLDTSMQQLTDNVAYDLRLQNFFAIVLSEVENGPPEEVLFVRFKFYCRGYRGHEKFDIKVEYSLNNVAGLLLRDTDVVAESLDFVFRQNEPWRPGNTNWWAQTRERFAFLERRNKLCRWALMGNLDAQPNSSTDSDEEEVEPDYLEPDYEEKMLEFQSLKEIGAYAKVASTKVLPLCTGAPGRSSVRLLIDRRSGIYDEEEQYLRNILQSHGITFFPEEDDDKRPRGIRAPGGFPSRLRGASAALCLLGFAPDPSFICYVD